MSLRIEPIKPWEKPNKVNQIMKPTLRRLNVKSFGSYPTSKWRTRVETDQNGNVQDSLNKVNTIA